MRVSAETIYQSLDVQSRALRPVLNIWFQLVAVVTL
jgi:hypothetical protein